MTNNYTSHKRKLRQLKSLTKRLKHSLNDASLSGEVEQLIQKVKRLVSELQNVFAAWQLKKVLGPVCLFLGLSFSNNASAQVTFNPKQTNPFGLAGTQYFSNAAVADFDNDGDKDFITNSFYGDFYYFQNTGTASAPMFASPLTNSNGLAKTADTLYHFVSTADIDNDGDKDLMVGSYTGAMMYYQNTGSATVPTFAAPVANPFGLTSVYYMSAPTFVDYDGDGDWDLVAGEYGGNLQYFQNTGTMSAPAFGSPVQNPNGIVAVTTLAHPTFGDLDNDGDLDVMVGEFTSGNTKYFQNTGTMAAPVYATPVTNPFGMTAVNKVSMPSFVNLDGDTDLDLLVTDYDGNFNYWQNATPLGVGNLTGQTDLVVYPNPASDVVYFKGTEVQNIASVEVFDVTGRSVMSQNDASALNVKELAEGMYSVKITHVNEQFEIIKFTKK